MTEDDFPEYAEEPLAQAPYGKQKLATVLIAFAFFIVSGPFEMATRTNSPLGRIINLIGWLGLSVLIWCWIYFDALEHHQDLSTGLRVVVALFGLFGLMAYLIWSRGWSRGSLASAKALGMFIAMLLSHVLFGVLVTTLLDIPVPD